jgi:hypothetical protein
MIMTMTVPKCNIDLKYSITNSCYDITEILVKVALNTIKSTNQPMLHLTRVFQQIVFSAMGNASKEMR